MPDAKTSFLYHANSVVFVGVGIENKAGIPNLCAFVSHGQWSAPFCLQRHTSLSCCLRLGTSELSQPFNMSVSRFFWRLSICGCILWTLKVFYNTGFCIIFFCPLEELTKSVESCNAVFRVLFNCVSQLERSSSSRPGSLGLGSKCKARRRNG